jgi:PAS domain S-box-containing protein
MSKRERHLKQRLDELFSSSVEPAETQPETPAAEQQAQPLRAADSIGPTPAAPIELSYLQGMINELPLPAYIKDHEHTWVAINAAFARLIGQAPEALLGHSDKEQADAAWQLDDRVLDAGLPEETQETLSLPDGSICTRRTRRTPLPAAGQPRFVMGVVEETFAAPQRTEIDSQIFQQGLERSPTAIFITNRDGVITYVNPAFEKIYGYTRAEAIGQTPRIIKSGLMPAERYQHFWTALLAGQTVAGEIINRTRDGRLVPVEGSNNPILDENGNIVAFLALHTDISARKQSEEDLLARNKQLAMFNRVGQELARLASVQEVIDHVFEAMGQVFDNRNLYIALYDERKQEISFPVYTIEGERRNIAGRPFGNGMTEHILRTKKTLLIRHEVKDFAANAGIDNIGRPAQCYLGIPLLSGDKALGVIAVQDYEREDAYSSTDVDMLSAIAAQTATALENVRLYAAEARRALQLQTAAEISTTASSVLDVDQLLPFVVNLIQQRFNWYYVGLFLVDVVQQNAVLRAGTGEAGQIMLQHHHQLPIDERSMIGWCIQHQVPRIALDVGEEAVRFNNPDLPETRSELALPLVSRGQVLGAMTVQSQDAAAFSEQDVAVLQTMIDQVATAIANAQLFEEAGQARQQAEARLRETLFLQSVGQAVSSSLDLASVMDVVMETLQHELGFTHNALALLNKTAGTVTIMRASGTAADLQGLTRSIEQLQNDIMMDILNKGQIEVIDGWDDRFDREIFESQGHAALVRAFAPLQLRGESIGLLEVGYRRAERARITPEEVRLLSGLADQIAIAVGNARLFDESQQRITEMAVVNEIGRTLMVTQDVQQLFATIHQQVGRLFDASNFFIATYDGGDEWSSDYQHERGQLLPPQRYKLGSGFTSYILQMQQPLLMRSAQENLTFHDRQNLPALGEMAKSWLGVPLMVGGRIIGVMGIQSYDREGLYTEQDVALFSTIGTQAAAAIQNVRLFQEARLRATELTALNELSQTLAAQLDVSQVLNEVWRGVSRLLDTTNFYIALYDPDHEQVSFPINASESVLDKEIEVMPADQGLTGYIIRTRQPLLITENTSQHVKALGLDNIGGDSQSYLGVPLILGDQLLGVIAIQSYSRARLYTEHDQNLMTAIAGQAAIALQNARLFEEVQRRASEQSVLFNMAQALSAKLNVEQVLRQIYEGAAQLIDARNFYIGLYDAARHETDFVLSIAGSEIDQSIETLPADIGITGYIIRTRQSLLIHEDVDAWLTEHGVTHAGESARSYLGVPMLLGEQVLGAMAVQNYNQPQAFTEHDRDLLLVFGAQAAIAIQNARLFEQTQRTARREQTLREITSRVRSSIDPDAIARTAIRELGLALGRQTFIRLGDADQLSKPPQSAAPEMSASGPAHNTSLEGGQ